MAGVTGCTVTLTGILLRAKLGEEDFTWASHVDHTLPSMFICVLLSANTTVFKNGIYSTDRPADPRSI